MVETPLETPEPPLLVTVMVLGNGMTVGHPVVVTF